MERSKRFLTVEEKKVNGQPGSWREWANKKEKRAKLAEPKIEGGVRQSARTSVNVAEGHK